MCDALCLEVVTRVIELSKAELNDVLKKSTETMGIYFYTPLCGTCKLAERMLIIVAELLPQLPLYQCNINFMPDVARDWRIESVPCLAVIEGGELSHKEYALQSVPYLHERLKSF